MHTQSHANRSKNTAEYFSVIMRSISPRRALCREDREFEGETTHEFAVPLESADWTDEQRAAYALDCFHESIPLSEPEHFSFRVIWSDGREVCED